MNISEWNGCFAYATHLCSELKELGLNVIAVPYSLYNGAQGICLQVLDCSNKVFAEHCTGIRETKQALIAALNHAKSAIIQTQCGTCSRGKAPPLPRWQYFTMTLDMAVNHRDFANPKLALFIGDGTVSDFMESLCGAWCDFCDTDTVRDIRLKRNTDEMEWSEIVDIIPNKFLAKRGLTRIMSEENIYYDGRDTLSMNND